MTVKQITTKTPVNSTKKSPSTTTQKLIDTQALLTITTGHFFNPRDPNATCCPIET
jgi:hypothetical protein